MAVKEWNDEIIFVRQVTPGASERSFGIQVARLAGLPDQVVQRAKQILGSLENGQKEIQQPGDSVAKDNQYTQESEELDEADNSMPTKIVSTPKKRVDPSQLELF